MNNAVINLRMSNEVKEVLVSIAKKENRSLNNLIVTIHSRYIKDKEER